MSSIPKTQLILDYEMFFHQKPVERINFIKHISKENLLAEIAGLNFQLKPNDQLQIDSSEEKQKSLLNYYTKVPQYYKAFEAIYNSYKSSNANPIIFSRQTCIFALEEIVNASDFNIDSSFILYKPSDWIAILKYLLAVNYEITQLKLEDNNSTIETINPKLLPLNELSIESNPIFIPYRGYRLLHYLLNHGKYGSYLKSYLNDEYKLEPDSFIYQLMRAYFSNKHPDSKFNFFYRLKESSSFFDALSKRVYNPSTHKLLSIRKSPFIEIESLKYILSDNMFLLEKCYSQFINDFWFDIIKPKHVTSIREYRADFGNFFESYVEEILSASFSNFHQSVLFLFDSLKVKYKSQEIEITDVYVRQGSKIMLAEVKSGNIYDEEKYGGDAETLYKNNRNAFFKNFGVNQIIYALIEFEDKISLIDKTYTKGIVNEVYPCIIFNDKSLQTPFMAQVFNERFQELLKESAISEMLKINPLTLIHISDIEILEERFRRSPEDIWTLLEFNYRHKEFIPPFYNTVDRNWDFKKVPEKIIALYEELIHKNKPTQNGS